MYPVPPNEVTRLEWVRQSGILDSEFEEQFDSLVMHASEMFGVPISLVSILDQSRQWFKAVHGLDMRETVRDVAFCNYPVSQGSRFIVEDASKDENFASNPLVVEQGIRFYAGVPLQLEPGLHVGTLCILDTKPRRLSPTAIRMLDRLGHIAEALVKQFAQARKLKWVSEELSLKTRLLTCQNADLLVKQRLLEDAFRLAKMGAWERDLATGNYRWSDTLYVLHGIEPGTPITEQTLRGFYSDADWARLEEIVRRAYEDNSSYEVEIAFTTANNEPRHARISSAVELGDNGTPIRRFGLKQDITAEKEARCALHRIAEHDSLTGLLNRFALLARMDEHRSGGRPIGLMMLDLDGFKDVNDTSGHKAGDACLREIARRLQTIPHEADIARVGGDEFAILFKVADQPTLEALAMWVLGAVSEPFIWWEQGFHLAASIGISHSLFRPLVDSGSLLSEADLALYAAKCYGGSRYEFFSDTLLTEATRKMKTLVRVRAALNTRAFVLHYQPKIRLSDRKLVGLEALLRWQDGNVLRGPGEFRVGLEDTVLSREIGAYVLAEGMRQAGEWLKAGFDFGHVALNMSPQQFQDEMLVDELIGKISSHGLEPRHIQLEITEETVLSRSADEVRAACERLRHEGLRIAFDDFGTGFASLTHLINFPVDIIKIDRNFIAPLGHDERARSIVTSVIGMARNLELSVVAEGVETEEQRDLLLAMGCNVAQGYLFSPALSSENLVSFVDNALDYQPLAVGSRNERSWRS